MAQCLVHFPFLLWVTFLVKCEYDSTLKREFPIHPAKVFSPRYSERSCLNTVFAHVYVLLCVYTSNCVEGVYSWASCTDMRRLQEVRSDSRPRAWAGPRACSLGGGGVDWERYQPFRRLACQCSSHETFCANQWVVLCMSCTPGSPCSPHLDLL